MGTTTISNDDLVNIKLDLGTLIGGYTDSEIQSLWERASNASSWLIQYNATKAWVIEGNWMNAIGSVDYKAGNTQENLSQWVAQLERAYLRFSKYIELAGGQSNIAIGASRDTRPQPYNPNDYEIKPDRNFIIKGKPFSY